jgi:hypothetical protein
MTAVSVSPLVNSVANDGPEVLVAPVPGEGARRAQLEGTEPLFP